MALGGSADVWPTRPRGDQILGSGAPAFLAEGCSPTSIGGTCVGQAPRVNSVFLHSPRAADPPTGLAWVGLLWRQRWDEGDEKEWTEGLEGGC